MRLRNPNRKAGTEQAGIFFVCLLKQGLLQEHVHPNDKRSKLIELTDAGRAAFESVQTGITKLADTVVADLTEAEKTSLLQMLNKLHRFHKPIFEEADEPTLGKMLGG
jgi:DNA-binding PadR family transcriptional regulator